MATPLAAVRILLVDDDVDTCEILEMALGHLGATVQTAHSGGAALERLAVEIPDVVLCDLSLPDGSGLTWLGQFRALPGAATLPAIALSGRATEVDRERSLGAGFEKHINKPAGLRELVVAITTLVARTETHSLQPMLSQLARVTGCRFTSLLRFADDQLISVWTFDQGLPAVDPFPVDMTIAQSYCVLVKEAGAPITIENAPEDQRAAGHPKQHELATYVAAPVFAKNGEMFGTLCSYDPAPRTIDAAARAAIVTAAHELERLLATDEL